jgi:hypothetical protein
MNLKKDGDMHWNSHYGAVVSLICIFSSVIDAIEGIVKDDFIF